jgi:hypothetical protein
MSCGEPLGDLFRLWRASHAYRMAISARRALISWALRSSATWCSFRACIFASPWQGKRIRARAAANRLGRSVCGDGSGCAHSAVSRNSSACTSVARRWGEPLVAPCGLVGNFAVSLCRDMCALSLSWEKSVAGPSLNGGLLISGSQVRVLVRPPQKPNKIRRFRA